MVEIKDLTREQKIAEIYKRYADKTPGLGCKISFWNAGRKKKIYATHIGKLKQFIDRVISSVDAEGGLWKEREDDVIRIGRPVMIGDILDHYNKKHGRGGNVSSININGESIWSVWIELRKPIDDQPDECLDFILQLW